MSRIPATVIAAAIVLAGCAGTIPVPTTVATTGMPNPEAALVQSMQHVDAEMAKLGQLTRSDASASGPIVPAELQRVVSFEWNGPLDKAAAKLAASIGYTFHTAGPAGQQPLVVAIQLSSVPVYDVFQALGQEAGDRATVAVDPLHHQVQVLHHV
jgi:defect-in-organelle-trafficking protein DotD